MISITTIEIIKGYSRDNLTPYYLVIKSDKIISLIFNIAEAAIFVFRGHKMCNFGFSKLKKRQQDGKEILHNNFN